MKQLLLILACLLASGLSSATIEDDFCPAACSCTEEGIGPFVARCLKLHPEQKFGDQISRVVIENDNALVLDKNTFENLGLKHVSTIHIINCTFKKLDYRAFAGLKLLTTVELLSNKQVVLHPDIFNETVNLKQLIIRDCDLKFSKKSDYLFDIPLLTELEMSKAGITELNPEAFSKMPSLQTINVAFNKLKALGNEFVNLSDLEDVDLSHNLLGEVSTEAFKDKNLNALKLRGNLLTTMAGVDLPNLMELDVSLCKFSKIDKTTFSGFKSLSILNLSENALSDIAEDAFEDASLSELTNLDLSNNALQGSLPEGLFQNVPGLGKLSLAHNPKLQILPEKIFQGLSSLFYLDISVCGLKTLGGAIFANLEALSTVILARNDLSMLKPGVLNKHIVHLDLSHNKFEHLEDIKFPSDSRLRKLNLAGNKLSDLPGSALADVPKLEILDLSSCSLSTLWDLKDAYVLKSLKTLSVAKNFIHVITENQLALTPKLMGIDITGNPLVCNETFTATLQWLKKHKVMANNHMLSSQKSEMSQLMFDTDAMIPLRWVDIEEQICGESAKEPIEPVDPLTNDNDLDKDEIYNDDDSDDEDEEDEDEDEDEDDGDDEGNYLGETDSTNIPNNDLDNIVWRQSTLLSESSDNYLWSVIIVLFSVVAILFSLTILAACVLRWSRQRNSYGARMINTHLHPPKMMRGRSSIYEQLYEDPNHPTTPIMSMKNQNQTQYNFPEAQGNKQFGYITYLSKDFHDSTVIPESV